MADVLYGTYQQGFPQDVRYHYTFDKQAVAAVKNMAKLGLVGVVVRYRIDYMGESKSAVFKTCLEGQALNFLSGPEYLEAWGPDPKKPGDIKRANLRHFRWCVWDGKI